VRLSGARITATLGREPHTPLDEAIEATLEAIGCLPPKTAEAFAR
jgi:hypothetical protein